MLKKYNFYTLARHSHTYEHKERHPQRRLAIMEIGNVYLIPKDFLVDVNSEKGTIIFHVNVDEKNKSIVIREQDRDGDFTAYDVFQARQKVVDGINNATLQLPLFVPLSDVVGSDIPTALCYPM